jgi:hypothetical protein
LRDISCKMRDAGFYVSFRDCPAKGGTGGHPSILTTVCISYLPHACYISRPSHPLWVDLPNRIWWRAAHRLWNSVVTLCPVSGSWYYPQYFLKYSYSEWPITIASHDAILHSVEDLGQAKEGRIYQSRHFVDEAPTGCSLRYKNKRSTALLPETSPLQIWLIYGMQRKGQWGGWQVKYFKTNAVIRWRGGRPWYRVSTKELYTLKMVQKTNAAYLELHNYTSR